MHYMAFSTKQTMPQKNQSVYAASRGSDGKPYVNGPGDGLGYSSGTLWPDLRFGSDEEAKRAAKVANIAYLEGKAAALAEVRAALGIKG